MDRSVWGPRLALAVLAPTIGELLTGSTPVALLVFDPLGFVLRFAGLMLLYGGGALLIREAAVRWGGGWRTIAILGVAYGIVEEGLAVHTFFQSGGAPVHGLGGFGRVAGVNVVWATGLSWFHATYSMGLAVAIVGLCYPASRGRSLLGGFALPTVLAGYLAIVALFWLSTPNGPAPVLAVATVAVVLGLVGLAALLARWPPSIALGRSTPTRGRDAAVGAAPFLLWLGAGLAGPSVFGSPWVCEGLFLVGAAACVVYLERTREAPAPASYLGREYWFALGATGVLTAWAGLLVLLGSPGPLIVGGALLVLIRRRRPGPAIGGGVVVPGAN